MTAELAPARPRVIENLLFAGWWFLMSILPIGHVTGLRNTISVLVVFGTLAWLGKRAWTGLPALLPALALVVWCGASIGWSASPGVSVAKWQVDLVLPLLAAAAAFGYVRRTGRLDAILGGVFTGMVCLAVLSATAVLPESLALQVGAAVRTETFATVTNAMPIWFPGVGDASMATAMGTIGVLLCRPLLPAVPGRVMLMLGIAFAALTIFVLSAINNRNSILTILVVALTTLWLARRRASTPSTATPRGRARRVVVAVLVVGVAAGSVAMLESGARLRMRQMGVTIADDQSGLIRLTERDTRPMIWSYYSRLALRSPWIGVGFGRTVPGLAYGTQGDADLASIEANAYAHAHNLLLDWWLQTGIVGVALLVALLGGIVRAAWRAMDTVGTPRRAAACTVLALVATMLLRNMTDDLLVFGMATMFWVLVGSFLARAVHAPTETVEH